MKPAAVLRQGQSNLDGHCLECGAPVKPARFGTPRFYCEKHWHGRVWEMARRCTDGPDGKPCARCKASYREKRARDRRAEGAKPQPTEAERVRWVAIARTRGVDAAAAESGRRRETILRYCRERGAIPYAKPRPVPAHGTKARYDGCKSRPPCSCKACRAANAAYSREMHARTGRTLKVRGPNKGGRGGAHKRKTIAERMQSKRTSRAA